MATTTSVTMTYQTQSGKKATKSITYVNNEATDSQLYNLVSKLNQLTTNTLGSVNRITKKEINE